MAVVEIPGKIVGTRKLGSRGRLQVPKDIREFLGLREGDHVLFIKPGEDKNYVIIMKSPEPWRGRGRYIITSG